MQKQESMRGTILKEVAAVEREEGPRRSRVGEESEGKGEDAEGTCAGCDAICRMSRIR